MKRENIKEELKDEEESYGRKKTSPILEAFRPHGFWMDSEIWQLFLFLILNDNEKRNRLRLWIFSFF